MEKQVGLSIEEFIDPTNTVTTKVLVMYDGDKKSVLGWLDNLTAAATKIMITKIIEDNQWKIAKALIKEI